VRPHQQSRRAQTSTIRREGDSPWLLLLRRQRK
jgi:hypothetical protein